MNLNKLVIYPLIGGLLLGIISQIGIYVFYNDQYNAHYMVSYTNEDSGAQLTEDVLLSVPNVQVTEVNRDTYTLLHLHFVDITETELTQVSSILNVHTNDTTTLMSSNVDVSNSSMTFKLMLTLLSLLIGGIFGGIFSALTNNQSKFQHKKEESKSTHSGLSRVKRNSKVVNDEKTQDNGSRTDDVSPQEKKARKTAQLNQLNHSMRELNVKKLLLTHTYNNYNSAQFAMIAAFEYLKWSQKTLVINFNDRYTPFLEKYYKNKESVDVDFKELIEGRSHINGVIKSTIYDGVNVLDFNDILDQEVVSEVFVDYFFKVTKKVEADYDNILILTPEKLNKQILNAIEKHADGFLIDEQNGKVSSSMHQLDHIKKVQLEKF